MSQMVLLKIWKHHNKCQENVAYERMFLMHHLCGSSNCILKTCRLSLQIAIIEIWHTSENCTYEKYHGTNRNYSFGNANIQAVF